MNIVMLTAEYCGACKQLYPQLKKVSNEMSIPLEMLDVEDSPARAAEYGAECLPTVVLLSDAGFELCRFVGAINAGRIRDKFDAAMRYT